MAGAKRLIKRAARKTAREVGYTPAQAKAYAKGAVQAIRPAGVTAESKTYRKQLSAKLSLAQRRKVRKYDRTG